MRIIICIKQVPGTTRVDIDEETGVLKRSAASAKMNPYDLYAIETGMVLKEKYGAEIIALTMGPPYSEAILREAFMLGIDEGWLLTDRAFGGADCLATSYALSQAIKSIGIPDIILCGKQTTDGDTAQVGPELSEQLDIPCITNVQKILSVNRDNIIVESDLGEILQTVEVQFPCLLTVDQGIFEPRLPSYKLGCKSKNIEIHKLTLQDISDSDYKNYGLNGSPTRVVRVFPPKHDLFNQVITGPEKESAGQIAEIIKQRKMV